MAVAMAIDAVLGWPEWLFRIIGHPVTWLGRLIGMADRSWNREPDSAVFRRATGLVATLLLIALPAYLAWIVQAQLTAAWGRIAVAGILAWPLVALRSLGEHVTDVARPLQSGNIIAARSAVSQIVGRDPQNLDEAGIARASIESLSENASDGVVAPLFWGAILGLPGIVGYKAINTLDSMIGHRTPRHEAFGWAAARIDDAASFIPARLTGLLFALLAARPAEAISCMLRDARRHRSINAGWPEAAMASALGVRLSGPRIYEGAIADEPWLNGTARDPVATDIAAAIKIYHRAMGLLAAALVALAFA